MSLFLDWLEATPIASAVADSLWLFPVLETAHVLGIALLVGSIITLDLRVLGIAWSRRDTEGLARDVLPWTWIGFAIAVVTGLLMFISSASRYADNEAFLFKLILILLAGVNMLAFHFLPRNRDGWSGNAELVASPLSLVARATAALSLLFWIAIVGLGRWIGFV